MTTDEAVKRQAAHESLMTELVEALEQLLSLPVATVELAYLRKGIGIATTNAAWLRAEAIVARAKEQQQ